MMPGQGPAKDIDLGGDPLSGQKAGAALAKPLARCSKLRAFKAARCGFDVADLRRLVDALPQESTIGGHEL